MAHPHPRKSEFVAPKDKSKSEFVSKERLGDWDGLMVRMAPSSLRLRRATRPTGEWGYWTCRPYAGDVRPEAVLPDKAVCLPTLSDFLIVNKTSLSLSLSLFKQMHTHTHAHTHTHLNKYTHTHTHTHTHKGVEEVYSKQNRDERCAIHSTQGSSARHRAQVRGVRQLRARPGLMRMIASLRALSELGADAGFFLGRLR